MRDSTKQFLAQMNLEQLDREHIKATTPEPQCIAWGFEKELELLNLNGLAVIDFSATRHYRDTEWLSNGAHPRTYHTIYRWTLAGNEACPRYRNSPPMAWAQDMHNGSGRYCVVCGRDCFRKKVWAQDGSMRVVCKPCGGKGHGLQALARNEQEKQEAIAIEKHLDAMGKSSTPESEVC